MKKLTVIIPVYNEEPFLRRCFDSVIDSIGEEDRVEVVVVDDGSTDGSDKICDEYKDKFLVIHQKNQGVSVARNTGIENATGKYITFLDSDDVMTDNGIMHMLEGIEERDGQEIFQFEHQRYYTEYNRIALKYTNASRFYHMRMLPRMWCMVWNKVYLREFINKNHIRFKVGLQYGEDEIFNLECFKACDELFHFDRVSIMRYFENEQSLCHTLNREKLFAQNDALIDLLKQGGNSDEFERCVRGVLAEHWGSATYKKMFGGMQ